MNARSRATAFVMILTSGFAMNLPSRCFPLGTSALEEVARSLEGKAFKLITDVHEPDPRADSMQLPTLEKAGWHHHNPSGPVALKAGTRVSVSGVFNYADRGVVLELTEDESWQEKRDDSTRPRMRIRIIVEAAVTDSAAQTTEATTLIDKILAAADAP